MLAHRPPHWPYWEVFVITQTSIMSGSCCDTVDASSHVIIYTLCSLYIIYSVYSCSHSFIMKVHINMTFQQSCFWLITCDIHQPIYIIGHQSHANGVTHGVTLGQTCTYSLLITHSIASPENHHTTATQRCAVFIGCALCVSQACRKTYFSLAHAIQNGGTCIVTD